jgi:hypothetical protein
MTQDQHQLTRQCLLEAWLPLVQAMNQEHGWSYNAAQLEMLILLSAADLAHTSSAMSARVVVWSHYRRQRSRTP